MFSLGWGDAPPASTYISLLDMMGAGVIAHMCTAVVCVCSCESTLNLFTGSEATISQSLYPNQNAVAAYHPPCHHSCLVQALASVPGQSDQGMDAAANSLVKQRKEEGLLLEKSVP